MHVPHPELFSNRTFTGFPPVPYTLKYYMFITRDLRKDGSLEKRISSYNFIIQNKHMLSVNVLVKCIFVQEQNQTIHAASHTSGLFSPPTQASSPLISQNHSKDSSLYHLTVSLKFQGDNERADIAIVAKSCPTLLRSHGL